MGPGGTANPRINFEERNANKTSSPRVQLARFSVSLRRGSQLLVSIRSFPLEGSKKFIPFSGEAGRREHSGVNSKSTSNRGILDPFLRRLLRGLRLEVRLLTASCFPRAARGGLIVARSSVSIIA